MAALAAQFRAALPALGRGAIALIDSPRWPRDLDCAAAGVARRSGEIRGRAIDAALRRLVKETAGSQSIAVSMFPTPDSGYFHAQIAMPACKPHLRAFGVAMLGAAPAARAPYGGSFTRFMLAGFAAYRALEQLGVSCFEGYPDLQFRLWNGGARLPSKSKGGRRVARDARNAIIAQVTSKMEITPDAIPGTLDQADAAILALSAAAGLRWGAGFMIEHPAEGLFWMTFPQSMAVAFAPRWLEAESTR